MKSEHIIYKAELFLSRKMYNKVIETLENAINSAKEENDFVNLIRANCFLGEALFMEGNYEKASKYLLFVTENSNEIESYDDLLDMELHHCDLLLGLIERYGKGK